MIPKILGLRGIVILGILAMPFTIIAVGLGLATVVTVIVLGLAAAVGMITAAVCGLPLLLFIYFLVN